MKQNKKRFISLILTLAMLTVLLSMGPTTFAEGDASIITLAYTIGTESPVNIPLENEKYDYLVKLPSDTLQLAQIQVQTADSSSVVEYTQISDYPGIATAVITSADQQTTLTYTVRFVVVSVISIPVSEDTMINPALPDATGGTSQVFQYRTDAYSANQRALLFKFANSNLSAVDGEIVSAKIKFYFANNRTEAFIDIYGIGSDWSQSTATWNNRPVNKELIKNAFITNNYVWSVDLVWNTDTERTLLTDDYGNLDITNYIKRKQMLGEDASVVLQRNCVTTSGGNTIYVSSSKFDQGIHTPYLEVEYVPAGTLIAPEVQWPTINAIEYGQTFGDAISGGTSNAQGRFYIEDELLVPNANDAGYMKTIVFAPEDTSMYQTLTQQVTVVVNKADPVIEWPEIKPVSYFEGITLSAVKLPDGFTWNAPATELAVGLNKVLATCTVAETDNYNAIIVANELGVVVANTAVVKTTADSQLARTATGGDTTAGSSKAFMLRFASTGNYDVVLKFPYSGLAVLDGNIISAKLKFYYATNRSTTLINAYELPNTWAEGTVTANNCPSLGNQIGSTFTILKNYSITTDSNTPRLLLEDSNGVLDMTDYIKSRISEETDASMLLARAETVGSNSMFMSAKEFGTNGEQAAFLEIQYLETTDPTITKWPTISDITYGKTLSQALGSDGEADVEGVFIIEDADTIPDAGQYTKVVTFVPTYSSVYNSVTSYVDVTINKAERNAPSISADKTHNAITITPVDGAEYGIKLSGSSNEVVYGTNNEFTGLTSNTEYTAYIRIAETSNYHASEPAYLVVKTDIFVQSGDINADGVINISDVIMVAEIAVGISGYMPEQIGRANVSDKNDLCVDIADVVLLIERVANSTVVFPVDEID